MSSCLRPEAVQNAITNGESSSDTGNVTSTFNRSAETSTEIRQSMETIRQVQQEVMDNISQIIGGPSGTVALTHTDNQSINRVARQWVQEYDKAEPGFLQKTIDDTMRLAGTQANQMKLYTRLATWTAEKLTDGLAPVYSFIATNFPMNGQHITEHPTVAAIQDGVRTTQGLKNHYADMADELRSRASKLLRNSTATPDDLLTLAGDALNMEQVTVHNDLLIDNWKQQMNTAEALLKSGELSEAQKEHYQKIYRSTRGHIRMLENNRDSIITDYDIRSCGMFDGEAQAQLSRIYQDVQDLGVDVNEFRKLSHDIARIQREAEMDLVRTGQVTRDQLAQFADYEDFVSFASSEMNRNSSLMDIDSYMPGNFHEARGMKHPPVSAWYTVQHFGNRAAARAGMGKVGNALYSMNLADRYRNSDSHVRVYDWDSLLADKYSDNPTRSARYYNAVESANHGGGIVCVVPTEDAVVTGAGAGQAKYKRVFVQFDPTYRDENSGISGGKMNKGLTDILHTDTRLNLMGKTTAFMGRTCTSYTLGFSPMNGLRDAFERGVNFANRDFTNAEGQHIPGYKILGAYITQLPRAFSTLVAKACGKLDRTSQYGQFLTDFESAGLNYTYTKAIGSERISIGTTLADMMNQENRPAGNTAMQWARKFASKFGAMGDTVNHFIMAYNDVFNTAPALAQYAAMRQYGVERRQIHNSVSEIMDQSQQGKYTNALKHFFPFVTPTLQGARAMMRTCGLTPGADGKFHVSPRGIATMIGLTIGGSMLYSFAREALGKDDDTGRYYIDNIPVSQLSRFVPVPTNSTGDYFKLPTAFGVPQLAATLAICLDRVERGVSDPDTVFPELFAGIIKQMTPLDSPEYNFDANPVDWLLQTMSPALLRPMVDVGVNKNFRGNPITYYESGGDSYKSAADSGWASTASEYKTLARQIRDYVGIDVAPEQIRALIKGYSTGVLRFLPEHFIEANNPARDETGMYNKLGAGLYALGGTMYAGEVGDATRGMFSAEQEKLTRQIRRSGVNIVDAKMAQDTNGGAAYRQWRMEQLRAAGWNEIDVERFRILDEAASAIKKAQAGIKQRVSAALDMDDMEGVREVFRETNEIRHQIYADAVNQLNDLR